MEPIPSIIHESWHKLLQPLFDDEKMKIIKHEILPSSPFYPLPENIFRVFSMPLQDIKVVILGQDPYPNGEAIGYAFAINENYNKPASLRIIESELINSYKIGLQHGWSFDKTLQRWVNQGVFLLNTALTVEYKNAGSHLKYWEWFSIEVIRSISFEANPLWLLWGKKAQNYSSVIQKNPNATIINAPHPAAQCYGGDKFVGTSVFIKANEYLVSVGKEPIKW